VTNFFNRCVERFGFSAFVLITTAVLTSSSAHADISPAVRVAPGPIQGPAVPIGGINYYYFYAITPVPTWSQGNPQSVGITLCSAVVYGQCGTNSGTGNLSNENFAQLTLLNGGYGYAYDTFYGEQNNFIGADVSVPTARWVAPAVYTWLGGGVAFFNSRVGGVNYANMLLVGDPAATTDQLLDAFSSQLGDTIPLPADIPITGPGTAGGNFVVPFNDNFTPEPSMYAPLLIGLLFLVGWQWKRRRTEV
jgi:hypothetical protein